MMMILPQLKHSQRLYPQLPKFALDFKNNYDQTISF